jgi:proton-coupled amino acid transporter
VRPWPAAGRHGTQNDEPRYLQQTASKQQANSKQTASKQQANSKQTASKQQANSKQTASTIVNSTRVTAQQRTAVMTLKEDLEDTIELVELTDAEEDVQPLVGLGLGLDEDTDAEQSSSHALHASHARISPPTNTETAQITVNIIISFVGAGLLGIPHAFSRAGWLLGSIALAAVSALNVYSMLLLPKVRRHLNSSMKDSETSPSQACSSYGDMGKHILGHRGEVLVNICLVVSQTGFATAYLIFIAESLYRAKRWKVCFGAVPGLALLVQARDMKHLSPFSLLANCANLLGLSAVLLQDYETFEEHHEHHDTPDTDLVVDPIKAVQWGGVMYVMAVTLYSMEGVGLVLSLENSCRDRSRFPGLLRNVVAGITLFMALFGTAGYWAFGSETLAPITLNLGHSRAASIVQGALCVALYFTYPIMMFPVWTIAEERILEILPSQVWKRRTLRASVVLTTAVVAYAVPDFGEYLSLLGSSLCTILGFLLPTYFHLQVFGKELGKGEFSLNVTLFVGGALFAVVGTASSLRNMMAPG